MKIKIVLYVFLMAVVLAPQWLFFEPDSTTTIEFIVRAVYFFLGLLGGDQIIGWICNKLKEK